MKGVIRFLIVLMACGIATAFGRVEGFKFSGLKSVTVVLPAMSAPEQRDTHTLYKAGEKYIPAFSGLLTDGSTASAEPKNWVSRTATTFQMGIGFSGFRVKLNRLNLSRRSVWFEQKEETLNANRPYNGLSLRFKF